MLQLTGSLNVKTGGIYVPQNRSGYCVSLTTQTSVHQFFALVVVYIGGQDEDRQAVSEVEGGAGPGHEVSRLIIAVGVAWEGSIIVVRVVADRSVGLITVVGRVITVVCVRQRCMHRLRSLS